MSYYNFGLPPGEVPHNPLGLHVHQVGKFYRLLATREIRTRPVNLHHSSGIQVWLGTRDKGHWCSESNALVATAHSTYRVPASFPIGWDDAKNSDAEHGLPADCTPHNPDEVTLVDLGVLHRLLCLEEDWNVHPLDQVEVWDAHAEAWRLVTDSIQVMHPTRTYRVPKNVPITRMVDMTEAQSTHHGAPVRAPHPPGVRMEAEAFDALVQRCAHIPWGEVCMMDLLQGLPWSDARAEDIRRIQLLASKLS